MSNIVSLIMTSIKQETQNSSVVYFGKIFKNFALRLLSAVIGGVIYYIVITFVIAAGLPANDLKLFSALVVAVFLGIPYWKNKVIGKKVKRTEGAQNA